MIQLIILKQQPLQLPIAPITNIILQQLKQLLTLLALLKRLLHHFFPLNITLLLNFFPIALDFLPTTLSLLSLVGWMTVGWVELLGQEEVLVTVGAG
jgi:hypothetical protein